MLAVVKRSTLKAFREIATEPDEDKRREACMEYLEFVWDEAKRGRRQVNSEGVETFTPDINVMRDIALTLPDVMGVAPPTSKRKLPDLGVFGKKAG